jgi:AcrR family transcriptional regulator
MRLNHLDRSRSDTRDAIRAAAEELYAEHGINGVTTRALAERASVNMAAVNYHFGNKDNLTLEVFRDVCRRTVIRRLESLDRIEAQAKATGTPARIAEIVEAFVDAYVNEDDPQSGILLAEFVLKHRVEPNEWTRAIVAEELDELALRYIAALNAAAPHLTPREAHWRYHLMVGAILMTLSDEATGGRIARLSDGLCAPENRMEFRREMVAFLSDAFGRGEPQT